VIFANSKEFVQSFSFEFLCSGAQTEKFEDLPKNLLFFKGFSKFFGGPVPIRPVFWLLHCFFSFCLYGKRSFGDSIFHFTEVFAFR
jgi:hypothetical protein